MDTAARWDTTALRLIAITDSLHDGVQGLVMNPAGFNHAGYALTHPEYRAFAAALYGKSGAHAEAIVEYEAALRLAPRTGTWWIGLGLANEAEDRLDAATDAYRNARATGSLSATLSEFVERKLQRKH